MTKTFDLLMQSNLEIIAEIEVEERLGLFSRGGSLAELKRLYSDAHYFSLAEEWVKANFPRAELIVEQNPTTALAKLQDDSSAGMIWLETLGHRLDLPVLARGIESDLGSLTRFVVLGNKGPAPTGRDKTSLLCSVEERAGALREILQPFSVRGITMLRIESRPMRNRAWEYVFFIDISGHQDEKHIGDAIEELRNLSSYLKVLGSYPVVCQS